MGLTFIPKRIEFADDTIRIQLHDQKVAARRREVLRKLPVTSGATSWSRQRSWIGQKQPKLHRQISGARALVVNTQSARTLQTTWLSTRRFTTANPDRDGRYMASTRHRLQGRVMRLEASPPRRYMLLRSKESGAPKCSLASASA